LKLQIEQLIESNGFQSEFNDVEEQTANANLVGDFSSALQPYNIKKNRYKNILPFEKTRATLIPSPTQEGSDFISANYISGEGNSKMYIATQGPLQHTAGDFWRLIWEHETQVIVMLTKEIENGKEKMFCLLA